MALNSLLSRKRCATVLSGGNGERLRDVVYARRGDHLPKQYNSFAGRSSMLEDTFRRAEKMIPPERVFVVIAREHLKFDEVRRQIGLRPPDTVVVQPENKDTAPGILLPLLHLDKRYPDAAAAIFLSDHFIVEEDLFMEHVNRAFRIVEQDRSRIVLLGMEPREPDPDYGYIVPGEETDDSGLGARRIHLFMEKPSATAAEKIIRCGAVWNTLVMVFRCGTLIEVFRQRTTELYQSFQPILKAIGTPEEQAVTEDVYCGLQPINFSKAVLELLPYSHHQSLLVLPVRGVTWSDWGARERLLSALGEMEKFALADGHEDSLRNQDRERREPWAQKRPIRKRLPLR